MQSTQPSLTATYSESDCVMLFFFPFHVFVLQPTLPPSENRTDYDSEDSQNCQDEEDDDDEYEDAFEPNMPQKEHSNHNSYR